MHRWIYGILCFTLIACSPYRKETKQWKQWIKQAERIEQSAPWEARALLDSVKHPVLLPDKWLVRYCQVACRLADSIRTPLPYLFDLEHAHRYLEKHGEPIDQARMSFYLGRSMQEENIFASSFEYFAKAEMYSRAAGDRYLSARIWLELANWYAEKKDIPKAQDWARKSLPVFRQTQDSFLQARAWQILGQTYVAQDSLLVAQDCIHRADSLFRLAGRQADIVSLYNKVGEIYQESGHIPQAKYCFQQAVDAASPQPAASAFIALGTLYLQEDSLKQVEYCLQEARKSALGTMDYIHWLRTFANMMAKKDDYHTALDSIEKARQLTKIYEIQRQKERKEWNQKAEEHMELFEKKLNLPGLSQQISILKYVMVFLLFVLFFQIAYHVYQKRKYRKKLKSMMDEMKELYKDNQKSRQELAEQMKFYKQAYWNSRLMQSQQEEAKVQLLPFLQYRQQKWQETTDFLNGIFSNNELVDFLTKDLFIRKKLVENQVKIRELDIEISRYDKKNSLYRIQILREQYRLLQDNKACILRGLLSINRTIVKEIPSYARIKKRIKNPDKVKPLGKRDWKSMQKILHYFYPSLQKCLDEAGFIPLEQRYSYLSFFRLTNQENALWLGIPSEKAEETGRQIQEKLSLSQKKNALLCYLLTRD